MLSPEQRRLASCRLPHRQPDHHRAARRIIYGLGRAAICWPERTSGRCRQHAEQHGNGSVARRSPPPAPPEASDHPRGLP